MSRYDFLTPSDKDRQRRHARAWSRALRRMAKRYPDEFAGLLAEEKAAEGITPSRRRP